MTTEPDWENAVVRPVPVTDDEVRHITANPRYSWGYRTVKVMAKKDPEAVYASGLLHPTLTGDQWREIRALESGYYVEGTVIEGGNGIARVARTDHSRRSRQVKAASANPLTNSGGGDREMLTNDHGVVRVREIDSSLTLRRAANLTVEQIQDPRRERLVRGVLANRNEGAMERAQTEISRQHGGEKNRPKWWQE